MTDNNKADLEDYPSMTFPAILPEPSIRAYPFMSLILKEFDRNGVSEKCTLAHLSKEEIQGMFVDGGICGHAEPSYVPERAANAIIALKDPTFGQIAKIIDLRVDSGEPPATKAELAEQCASQEESIKECLDGFRNKHMPEQLQAWLLSSKQGRNEVHWGLLSKLYNASEDDQKHAIHELFESCFNINLESLYTVQGHDISLPHELVPVVQVQQRGDETWCLNETKGIWQKDHVYQSQFLIEGRAQSSFDGHTVIATATTFNEALALATAYAKSLTQSPGFSRISITEQEFGGWSFSKMHMAADLRNSGSKTGYAGKLSWNLDKLEKPYSEESTFRDLLKIERAIGVKWAQTYKLENDLGM